MAAGRGSGNMAARTYPAPDRAFDAEPIDRAHLARQTLGDEALEAEVLGLFVAQLDVAEGELAAADTSRRRQLAHALVGSARGVGAFALGDCAAAIEDRPGDAASVACFGELADEVRRFVAGRR